MGRVQLRRPILGIDHAAGAEGIRLEQFRLGGLAWVAETAGVDYSPV
jgi:hypothetical protein